MSQAQNTSNLHYSLSIPEPHTHYVKVEMEIVAPEDVAQVPVPSPLRSTAEACRDRKVSDFGEDAGLK